MARGGEGYYDYANPYYGNTGYYTGYQGTTGYQAAPNYHGATGYQSIAGYQEAASYPTLPSYSNVASSFSGLDAGLSVLALLSFGVWLFNLILPQLQGAAGLGLTGLFSRSLNPPQDTPRIQHDVHTSAYQLVYDVIGGDLARNLQADTQTNAKERVRHTAFLGGW